MTIVFHTEVEIEEITLESITDAITKLVGDNVKVGNVVIVGTDGQGRLICVVSLQVADEQALTTLANAVNNGEGCTGVLCRAERFTIGGKWSDLRSPSASALCVPFIATSAVAVVLSVLFTL